MANYATLKAAIQQVIKTNGNKEITGALLQQSLLSMIDSLGAGYQYMGVATPDTAPGTPDQKVFYIAGPGTYPNFNSFVVGQSEFAIFKYATSWQKETFTVCADLYKQITGELPLQLSVGFYKNDLSFVDNGSFKKAIVDVTNCHKITINASVCGDAYISLTNSSNTILWQTNSGQTRVVDLSQYPTAAKLYLSNETSVVANPSVIDSNSVNQQIATIIEQIDLIAAQIVALQATTADLKNDVLALLGGTVDLSLSVGFYKNDLSVNTSGSFKKAIVDVSKFSKITVNASVRADAYISLTDASNNILWQTHSGTSRIIDLTDYPTAAKLYLSNETSVVANPSVVVDGIIDEMTGAGQKMVVTGDLAGYIDRTGAIAGTSGTWIHSPILPIDAFLYAENFVTHSVVSNIAFYDRAEIGTAGFLGYFNAAGQITNEQIQNSIPAGTKYFVASTDGANGNTLKVTLDKILYELGQTNANVAQLDSEIEILQQRVGQLEIKTTPVSPKMLHISFDDTIGALYDLGRLGYSSIFQSSFFGALKTIHDATGAVFSCYCFVNYLDSDETTVLYSLTDVPATFAAEFAANSDWLKFGFHSIDNYTNYSSGTAEQAAADYQTFLTQIMRITGSVECIDLCVRLQNFAGNLVSCKALRDSKCGIIGLLASDYSETATPPTTDYSNGYYLTAPATGYLGRTGRWYDDENQLYFFPSNLRLDNIAEANVVSYMNQNLTIDRWGRANTLIMYMHENQAYNVTNHTMSQSAINKLTSCANWGKTNGYSFGYPMNKIRSVY